MSRIGTTRYWLGLPPLITNWLWLVKLTHKISQYKILIWILNSNNFSILWNQHLVRFVDLSHFDVTLYRPLLTCGCLYVWTLLGIFQPSSDVQSMIEVGEIWTFTNSPWPWRKVMIYSTITPTIRGESWWVGYRVFLFVLDNKPWGSREQVSFLLKCSFPMLSNVWYVGES